MSVTKRGFYDGIERNSSIQELFINCCSIARRDIADEELHGIGVADQTAGSQGDLAHVVDVLLRD